MIRCLAGLVATLLCASSAFAEAPPLKAPGVPFGTGTQPVAIYDKDGNVVGSAGSLPTTPAPLTAGSAVVPLPQGTATQLSTAGLKRFSF
ncbi:hypothetical protein Maq22A_1p36505 (plasmid) [Methylobacterium aquaticum]|uniref:Uncharacterized protein n=1 Tax=Methylobacterium aquaticum TaxID=270351 RepID=A0A0C6G117_9HYPH|nr:hypothetical protein Maq22A_1p36505 [Methylobacterium aquaticum]